MIFYQYQNNFTLSFPIAALTNYHTLIGLNDINLYSCGPRGQKSRMGPQGYIPTGGSKGNYLLSFFRFHSVVLSSTCLADYFPASLA